MGRPKTTEEKIKIFKEILKAWYSLRETRCAAFLGVAGDNYYNCARKILEEIERANVEKYGDFPELEELMLDIFIDKNFYNDISYFFGVKLEIYNDLATKHNELKSLDICGVINLPDNVDAFYSCVRQRLEDLEEYGIAKYPARDVEYYITRYLYGGEEKSKIELGKIGYKFGVKTDEKVYEAGDVIGGRRKSRKSRKSKKSRKSRKTSKKRH